MSILLSTILLCHSLAYSLSFNTPSKGGQGEDGEIPSSSEKLKGVIWPGMDLFDTATPSMKKKRNQKKPVVVLENMLACSKAIEPAEVSYHADGTFRKSRDVFGPLSEDEFSLPVCIYILCTSSYC